MVDAATINRMLVERGQEFCAYLFPNGKVKGNQYFVGNIQGDVGETLQITLTGAAAGRFKDFADPDHTKGATFLWLLAKAKGIAFPEAIRQACDWLGVKEDDFGVRRQKERIFAKPEKGGVRLAEPNTPVMDYLVVERRLDPLIIASSKICETDEGDAIVFPFLERNEDGKEICVHRKYLRIDRKNGKKDISTTKGTKRCLFGKTLISDNTSEIVITEGEIDSLSAMSMGIPAVSVPNGVSDFEWVDIDWDWLQRFEKIYVCMDMDEPGQAAAQEVCKRLGLHRCYIVSLPHKDVNDCLKAGITRDQMLCFLSNAKQIELDEIKRPSQFTSEVIDYYTVDWSKRGWETPWYPSLPWRVRKGEFTVLSGFSGSGKTLCLNQLMLHLIQQGVKIMDASLEVKPGLTLYNMTRCALGKKENSEAEIRACCDWISEHMFFLDCIGTVSVARLMHAMEYARKRHGVDVFVIDSLFKCGLDPNDFGVQRDFADKLTTFCNNSGAHVILVAHSRKTQTGNEFSIPTKADVAGSSDLTNAAFNVVIWWRNKLKKHKLDEARAANPPDMEAIAKWIDQPDAKALLDKQRFGEGEEASVHMWLNHDSYQFHPTRNTKTPYFRVEPSAKSPKGPEKA